MFRLLFFFLFVGGGGVGVGRPDPLVVTYSP